MTELCPCLRPRVGCEYHDPALQPVEYEYVAALDGRPRSHDAPLGSWLDFDSILGRALAEDDARIAAAGGVSQFAWQCIRCRHVWGTSCALAYADPAWCPKCKGAKP